MNFIFPGMPASREFMVICQAQLSLLVENLGVSSAIVYLTESWDEGASPQLQQIACVPIEGSPRGLQLSSSDSSTRAELDANHQLVLPLIQDERVLGVLVAERSRPWDSSAQPQVDAIRQALTAACLLDQRSQWFEQQSLQQQTFQRQQKDLFDNLLHQFRNPLTAMRTFGKLLMKRLTESDRNREAAGSIVRESDRLQALLVQFEEAIDAGVMIPEVPKVLQSAQDNLAQDDLAQDDLAQDDLAQDNLGMNSSLMVRPATLLAPSTLGRSLSIVAVDLLSILKPALQSASGIIDDRQQQLHLDLPTHSIPILADSVALAEVLTNLLDNASKYTPLQGHIQIKLTDTTDRVDLWITDTGYGIPVEDLVHLFERHYRGIQAQSNIPGTGLGLSIARELMRQMQGDIQIFSPPPKHLAWPSENLDNLAITGTSIRVTLLKAEYIQAIDEN